jgi:hypothetical protein
MLKRWLAAHVAVCQRFKAQILLGVVALSVVCGVLAGRLEVDPQISSLLPDDTASAQSLDELEARLPGSAPLYLLVQSDALATSRQLARQLHTEVSKWPETRWAMYKRDPSVFTDSRLLYLSAEDLEELNEQIDERERWESCKRIPGCTNLDDEAPPLPTDADIQQLFEKDPDVRALVGLFGKDSKAFVEAEPDAVTSEAAKHDTDVPAQGVTELGELCDAKNNVCSIEVQLAGDSSNLAFASEILERSEALFARVIAESGVTGAEMAVSGQFRNLPVTKRMVNRDLATIGALSSALVLLVMLFHFRGLWALVALFGPALLGILWTVGGLGWLHPKINLISAFTLAVLAGVGVDFGVHLLTHYSEVRRRSRDNAAALLVTLESLFPSLLVAAFTTGCGFAALGVASFHGFSEMGPVAAAGIAVSLLAFLVVLPPLVLLIDQGERCPFELRRYSLNPWPRLGKAAVPIALLGVLATVGLGWVGRDLSFEYDFRKLRPSGVAHGIPWGGTLHGTSRTAVYLLADDEAALREAASGLRADRPSELVKGEGSFVLVPAAFIPSDQKARLERIEDLADTLARAKRNATGELAERIERFEPLTAVKDPLTLAKLPRWVSEWLVERDGSFGTLAIVYVDLSGSDARDMELLVGHMRRWRERYPQVRFASSVAQLGEVVPRLRSEAPTILGLALLGVAAAALFVGRSLRRLLFVLLPLVVMVGASLGLMVAFDLRVNLYNMLVFPLAFGIGVDGAVYVTWAFGAKERDHALGVAARAVLFSTLTSLAAFGSLMVSTNPGMASIGALAMLMLGVSLVTNLVWLPSLHRLASRFLAPKPK